MDQKLKQRVVGIIVLTAIAAIFLPMMFDDPVDKSGRSVSNLKIPQRPKEAFDPTLPKAPERIEQVRESKEVTLNQDEREWMTFDSEEIVEHKVVQTEKKPTAKSSTQLQRWIIQVGSFGEEKNAVTLRDKLRKQGFPAFVEKYESMFRVRIGPELDQKRAEQMKQKLEKETQLKSILVSE